MAAGRRCDDAWAVASTVLPALLHADYPSVPPRVFFPAGELPGGGRHGGRCCVHRCHVTLQMDAHWMSARVAICRRAGFCHPNVFPQGDVCLSIINPNKGWKPSITVRQILVGVADLLADPNVHDPANEIYRVGAGGRGLEPGAAPRPLNSLDLACPFSAAGLQVRAQGVRQAGAGAGQAVCGP